MSAGDWPSEGLPGALATGIYTVRKPILLGNVTSACRHCLGVDLLNAVSGCRKKATYVCSLSKPVSNRRKMGVFYRHLQNPLRSHELSKNTSDFPTHETLMIEIVAYIIAIPVAIVVVIGTLLAVVYLAGKVTNALAKTSQHPKFGAMRYVMGVWTYYAPVGQNSTVAIHVPGNRSAPDAKAEALVQKIVNNWVAYESRFLDAFAAEILEHLRDEDMSDVITLARSSDKTALLDHTELDNISIEKSADGKNVSAWISFLHAWDPEHTRSLVVDSKGTVEDYGLSVGM